MWVVCDTLMDLFFDDLHWVVVGYKGEHRGSVDEGNFCMDLTLRERDLISD